MVTNHQLWHFAHLPPPKMTSVTNSGSPLVLATPQQRPGYCSSRVRLVHLLFLSCRDGYNSTSSWDDAHLDESRHTHKQLTIPHSGLQLHREATFTTAFSIDIALGALKVLFDTDKIIITWTKQLLLAVLLSQANWLWTLACKMTRHGSGDSTIVIHL